MERFNTHLTLTSSEAAGLLGVHPSTVKRWCNEGQLPYASTGGGHRRIPLDDAVAFARSQDITTVLTPFHPFEPHVWTALRTATDDGSFRELHTLAMGWVLRGDSRRLEQLYVALGRSPAIDFCSFCDDGIRGLMRLVGNAWSEGRLRVGEEHLVSQVMIDVLLRLRAEWLEAERDPRAADGDRVAVVGTLEGNHHHLGALCVRILLERLGWRVHYVGPDVPVDDFGMLQKARDARLLCVSVGPVHSIGDVRRCMRLLEAMYDRSRPYGLIFGGAPLGSPFADGPDGPFESVQLLGSCGELARSLGPTSPGRPEPS